MIRNEPTPSVLLDAFVSRLRDRLVQHALDAIRPAAVEEANRVIEEMRPAIEKHYSVLTNELVLRLTVKEPKS